MGEQKNSGSIYGQLRDKYSNFFKSATRTSPSDVKNDTKYAVLPKADEEVGSKELPSANDESPEDEGYHSHTCFQLLVGWICMVLAIFAGASIGPVFKFMMSKGVTPLLASSWRNQTMVLALFPVALWEAYSNPQKVDWFGYKPDLPYPVIVHILISGVAWAFNLLSWVVGLQYVTTFKASIVASSHPVLLVIAMQFTGHSVSMAEWIGVFVSFGGMFISEIHGRGDHVEATDSVPWKWQLYGYSLCLLAAAGEVVTILNRIKTRKYVPLMQYTLATSILVMLSATTLAVVMEDAVLFKGATLCTSNQGLLGWTAPEWRLKMLVFGLWVGAVCITGFNYAMQYIPPLVFSSVTLVDPAVTAIISWIFGIEHLPGLFSWVGGAIVIAGVAVISYGERERERAHKSAAAGHDTLDYVIPSHHNSIHGIDLDDGGEISEDEESGFDDDSDNDVSGRHVVEMRPLREVRAM